MWVPPAHTPSPVATLSMTMPAHFADLTTPDPRTGLTAADLCGVLLGAALVSQGWSAQRAADCVAYDKAARALKATRQQAGELMTAGGAGT